LEPTHAEEMSDGDLMAILGSSTDRKKKADALEELRRRYEAELLACARAVLRDRVVHGLEAQDVVQELFAELLFTAKAGRFDRGKSLDPWLRAVVRNKARDLLRREHRHLSLLEEDPSLPSGGPDQPGQKKLEVEELLEALGPEDRELCEQFYLYEYSAEEIALAGGLDKEQIYRDLHRIRTRLRQLFSFS